MSPADAARARYLMQRKLPNYLRTYRKRAGLTQGEVAFLLDGLSGAKVSRDERRTRRPNLRTAFGYQVIFGAAAHELLAGLFAEVEQNVIRRASLLSSRLDVAQGAGRAHRTRLKLKALDAILSRRRSR